VTVTAVPLEARMAFSARMEFGVVLINEVQNSWTVDVFAAMLAGG
jgi:hypothetical protein